MSNSILAIVEFDNYPEIVAQRAAWLARSFDAELTLLLCESHTGFLMDSLVLAAEARKIADEIKALEVRTLDALKKDIEGDGLVVHTDCNYDFPVTDSVLDLVAKLHPLYVVKGTHYHKPSERVGLTDTDWQLIRKINCPLWFAKPQTYDETSKIIAAVDPTHGHDKPASLDADILEHAARLSEMTGSRIELIHTYQRVQEIGQLATWAVKPEKLPIDELDERIKSEHSDRLHEFASAHGIPDDQVHQLPGRPHEILPVFARSHGAGLLIMGAISRSSLKQSFIGNTAQRTLDHVTCDVLVVPPSAQSADREAAA